MILAISKHGELSVFESTAEAEIALEAFDVQEEHFEFCDEHGKRLVPEFIILPKVSKWWIFKSVEIGAFKLNAVQDEGSLIPEFLKRAESFSETIEHSSFRELRTSSDLRQRFAVNSAETTSPKNVPAPFVTAPR